MVRRKKSDDKDKNKKNEDNFIKEVINSLDGINGVDKDKASIGGRKIRINMNDILDLFGGKINPPITGIMDEANEKMLIASKEVAPVAGIIDNWVANMVMEGKGKLKTNLDFLDYLLAYMTTRAFEAGVKYSNNKTNNNGR